MGIPLLYKDDLVGLLSIDKGQPHFFTERMVKVARAFANHAALAIATGRMPKPETPVVKDDSPLLMPRAAISIEEPKLGKEATIAGEGRETLLFGRILVQNRLATDAQVAEAMQVQRQLHATGISMKLGAIMLEKGFISVDTLYAALMIQKERFAIDSDPYALHRMGLTPEMDSLLGEWAVERGLITRKNLKEAIAIHQSIRALGVKSKRVGEILVDKGYLSGDALVRLLEERKAAGPEGRKDAATTAPVGPKTDAPSPVGPPESLSSVIAAEVEAAPAKRVDRKAAYEQELRASKRRLLLSAAVTACGVIALIVLITQLTGPGEDSHYRVRPAEELMGYAIPDALPPSAEKPPGRAIEAEESPMPSATASALSPLEEARKALTEAVARGSQGRAVLLARPFSDSGQRVFLVEGRLPFRTPCQGTAIMLFDGKEIDGISAPLQSRPEGFSAVVGPIHSGKRIAAGVYTGQVNLVADICGDSSGAIMYVPEGPDVVRPPAISFPLRSSFYLPGEGENDTAARAVVNFLRTFVKNAGDVAAAICAARRKLEQVEDIQTTWPDWEKEHTVCIARLNAMREELATFEGAYLACPYSEAVDAMYMLFETVGSCLAEMNSKFAQKAGVLPAQGEPALGATAAVALVASTANEKDVVASAAEEAEAVIARILAPEQREAARATEFLKALKSALQSACTEALAANRWLREEAPRRKSQYSRILAITERHIGLWKCKVESLSAFDTSMAKLVGNGARWETLKRLTGMADELAKAGTGAMVDTLYEFGFVPSAEIAALVDGTNSEGETSHAERIEEILQDLQTLQVGE
jgi:hypothetical protein